MGGVVGAIALAVLYANLRLSGDVAPLPYLPILNPLDLAQLLGLAAALAWVRVARKRQLEGWPADLLPAVPPAVGGLAFIVWNGMLARSVHHYAGVPFGPGLFDAVPLQVAFSISWTAIGLVITALASRKGVRSLWFVGAALLAVVVLKLFVVDLAQLSAVAKIGTFLVVGLLLLAVGYLAPVPPGSQPVVSDGPGEGSTETEGEP